MKPLFLFVPLILTSLAIGCAKPTGKSSVGEAIAPPTPQAPSPIVQEEEPIVLPESTRWTWANEKLEIEVQNVGWQLGEIVYDYTRVKIGARVRYSYRRFESLGALATFAESLKIDSQWTEDAGLWRSKIPEVLNARNLKERAWGNRTSLEKVSGALNAWLKTLSEDCARTRNFAPPVTSYETMGHLLIRPDWLFYADRWLGTPQSAFEVDWNSGEILGVVSAQGAGHTFQTITFGKFPVSPELELSALSLTGQHQVGADKIANVYGLSQCSATPAPIESLPINHLVLESVGQYERKK